MLDRVVFGYGGSWRANWVWTVDMYRSGADVRTIDAGVLERVVRLAAILAIGHPRQGSTKAGGERVRGSALLKSYRSMMMGGGPCRFGEVLRVW